MMINTIPTVCSVLLFISWFTFVLGLANVFLILITSILLFFFFIIFLIIFLVIFFVILFFIFLPILLQSYGHT